ncbi:MAG TPA: hypothetical protein PLR64_02725 [Candidatus Dojkabacteria bacterium]|nr:hypothetical protein [Candidatus Dojkabacteria bacterium]
MSYFNHLYLKKLKVYKEDHATKVKCLFCGQEHFIESDFRYDPHTGNKIYYLNLKKFDCDCAGANAMALAAPNNFKEFSNDLKKLITVDTIPTIFDMYQNYFIIDGKPVPKEGKELALRELEIKEQSKKIEEQRKEIERKAKAEQARIEYQKYLIEQEERNKILARKKEKVEVYLSSLSNNTLIKMLITLDNSQQFDYDYCSCSVFQLDTKEQDLGIIEITREDLLEFLTNVFGEISVEPILVLGKE